MHYRKTLNRNRDDDDNVLLSDEESKSERRPHSRRSEPEKSAMDDFIKNLVEPISRTNKENRSDDSDQDLPRERYFTFDMVNSQDNKAVSVDLIKKVLVNKCGELFEKMKKNNSKSKNRLKRKPVWKWEDEKEHPDPLETNKIRILALTYNMNAKKLPGDLKDLFRTDIKHDIYAIGTEECLTSIVSSAFGASKKKWVDVVQEYLGETYQIV